MSFLRYPRLPQGKVTHVLVSGEYPCLKASLEQRGIQVIETAADSRLPKPVRFHPDMQACPLLDKHMFVLKGNPLGEKLTLLDFSLKETAIEPGPTYPADALCDGLVWGKRLLGNPDAMDPAIQHSAEILGLSLLSCKQGYTACSVALVDKHSAITADTGIAGVLKGQGLDVLLIRPGWIKLPGYNTGFLGGSCGKLSPDKLAFTGQLSSHPDGKAIRAFLEQRGVAAVELSHGPLVDTGGILPLKEIRG